MPKNTEEDAYALTAWITKTLTSNRKSLYSKHVWDSKAWFTENTEFLSFRPPSMDAEEAFSSIRQYYIDHQTMLDHASEVEGYSSDEGDISDDEEDLEAIF
jgi:hypothetical protein